MKTLYTYILLEKVELKVCGNRRYEHRKCVVRVLSGIIGGSWLYLVAASAAVNLTLPPPPVLIMDIGGGGTTL